MRQLTYDQKLQSIYKRDSRAITETEEFTANMTFDSFLNNKMAIKAVSMNLLLIGENVKLIPLEIKQKYPQIPWARNESRKKLFSP